MKSRLLHNVLLALVVAGLALFLVFKPEKAGPQRFALSTLPAASVTRLDLAPAGKDAIVLEKRGDEWRMTAPFRARADDYRIAATLELLKAQSETRLPAKDLQKFELDPPFVRLRVEAGSRQQAIDIGGRQPLTNQLYVATGGYVYLVSPVYLVDVSRGAEDFLAKKLLADGESPTGFELPGLKLTLKDGRWQREPDDGKLTADELNRFVDEWKLATAMSVTRAEPGSGKPLAEVRVLLASGKRLSLALLAREPEVVLRRADEGLDYHFAPDAGARLLDPSRLTSDRPGSPRP
jgi:hypothetical protein